MICRYNVTCRIYWHIPLPLLFFIPLQPSTKMTHKSDRPISLIVLLFHIFLLIITLSIAVFKYFSFPFATYVSLTHPSDLQHYSFFPYGESDCSIIAVPGSGRPLQIYTNHIIYNILLKCLYRNVFSEQNKKGKCFVI